jgi:hypothetical protein
LCHVKVTCPAYLRSSASPWPSCFRSATRSGKIPPRSRKTPCQPTEFHPVHLASPAHSSLCRARKGSYEIQFKAKALALHFLRDVVLTCVLKINPTPAP